MIKGKHSGRLLNHTSGVPINTNHTRVLGENQVFWGTNTLSCVFTVLGRLVVEDEVDLAVALACLLAWAAVPFTPHV